MKINILIAGHAGQGPNALSKVVGSMLVKWGYYVFISREYGSVIRGGQNFNTITISDEPVMSNESKTDIFVVLESEFKDIKKCGIVLIDEKKSNMYFAGRIIKLFGIDFSILEEELKNIKNLEENIISAKKGYDEEKIRIPLKKLKNNLSAMDGSTAIAKGAIKSGVDVYFAYPMTPSTGVLGELAQRQTENNHLVLELEGEIAVINAAIGSAITGAKSMVGTSGGGFDLMTESLSLAGQAEVPVVIYLAQRPGPATGIATGTGQADLNIALNAGHGEFSRLVVAPGDTTECQELTSQAFYFSQKYKIPAIIISDKHLAESIYSFSEKPIMTKSQKQTNIGRYNSYEHDESGAATEDVELIVKNVQERLKKHAAIGKDSLNFETVKVYGDKKSKNIVLFWGSTKGAVIDASKNINAKLLQPLYLEPFPKSLSNKIKKAKKVIIVENNSTSQLSELIAKKTGFIVSDKNKILKYDGRPFYSDELQAELRKRLK